MTNATVNRFQILTHNQLQYPHKCGTCGSFSGDNNKRYIDFGCFVEYYGTVYLCSECFLSATKELGVISAELYAFAQLRIVELTAVVTTLIAENRTLRDAADHLRDSITSRPDTDTDSRIDSPELLITPGVSSSESEQQVSSPDSVRDASPSSHGEARPPESIYGGGHQDVHDDDTQHIGLDIFNI